MGYSFYALLSPVFVATSRIACIFHKGLADLVTILVFRCSYLSVLLRFWWINTDTKVPCPYLHKKRVRYFLAKIEAYRTVLTHRIAVPCLVVTAHFELSMEWLIKITNMSWYVLALFNNDFYYNRKAWNLFNSKAGEDSSSKIKALLLLPRQWSINMDQSINRSCLSWKLPKLHPMNLISLESFQS